MAKQHIKETIESTFVILSTYMDLRNNLNLIVRAFRSCSNFLYNFNLKGDLIENIKGLRTFN